MNCALELCIYHRDGRCILDETQINEYGMCDACILVSFQKEILSDAKQKQRESLERRLP